MIAVLTNDIDLEAHRSDWDALWQRTPCATPFQSPRWLLPWWHQFGTGLPLLAVAKRAGQLVGVLPLYALAAEGKILPIGAGTTDYFNGLGNATGLLSAVLTAAASRPFNVCELADVTSESEIRQQSVSGWHATWQEGAACPVLRLPAIPKAAHRKVRMSRHRADRIGRWTVEPGRAETISDDLDALKQLHQARWEPKGAPGVLRDERVVAFLREAAVELYGLGLIRIKRLHIDNQVIAIVLSLLAPGRIYFYLSGFDDAYAFISPGTLLIADMLEEAIGEQRTEAHFLRGREAYKYRWGATDRLNLTGSFRRIAATKL